MTIRGRFAPSPTGRLHLGNARSALLGWLQAKAAGGVFLLRIEDLDATRVRAELTETLLRDLEYLGLTWDETPVVQSQRGEAYRKALDFLASRGQTYPCFCTRAEIARAASAPHGPADDGPRYPGTCSALSEQDVELRAKARPAAIRFRVRPGRVGFEDGVHGRWAHDVSEAVGDVVIRRNDGVASYQLAVVVDDAASGITDVLRGDDLLDSTPRQILLYQALGLPVPRFAHVPLLLGKDGKRLAKRAGVPAVADLRERGIPGEAVIGLLAKWSGLGDGASVRAEELIAGFSLARVPLEPVQVDENEVARL